MKILIKDADKYALDAANKKDFQLLEHSNDLRSLVKAKKDELKELDKMRKKNIKKISKMSYVS